MNKIYHAGETIVFNNELYEFGYYTDYGVVIYIQGCRNMQDSYAVKLDNIKEAFNEDFENLTWGD